MIERLRSEQKSICDQRVLDFLRGQQCAWLRVIDVAKGCNISVRSAIMALARLHASKIHNVERSVLTKKRNGKPYPVYRLPVYSVSAFPSWLMPTAPAFPQASILQIRGHYINDTDN